MHPAYQSKALDEPNRSKPKLRSPGVNILSVRSVEIKSKNTCSKTSFDVAFWKDEGFSRKFS
ncbi:hypothetical protein PRIPAC_96306 [Pristionchus pacificus]|uniref:Uncharacterized protein n=1 Tax=Pristionchus pacificus TaxID=54126 RepID=A0A2A6D2T3_PRIPA|nr:hypothetical protein PRIPAC_96306 [Pristionchus pacificus]|eukprot:PDM84591.1 hypothetical protein PRIPAC_33614 [Pristionchus pacificus]